MKKRSRESLDELLLRRRLWKAANGHMKSGGGKKMSPGMKLLILWLTPGAPPPGPFG